MSVRALAVFLTMLALALAACDDHEGARFKPIETVTPAAFVPNTPTPHAPTAPRGAIAVSDPRRRIAFVSSRGGTEREPFHLFSMKPDGSDVRRLTEQPALFGPFAVSRDGTHIAFAGAYRGPAVVPPTLYAVNVATGATRKLGAAPATGSDYMLLPVQWQPGDASVLAEAAGCWEFFADGRDPIARDPGVCEEAVFRADGPGERWAAVRNDELATGIGAFGAGNVIDRVRPVGWCTGRCPHPGPRGFVVQDRPVWSPDGRSIAYADADGASGDDAGLAVIGADGSARRVVMSTALTPAAWSEDGRQIIFARGDVTLRGLEIQFVDVETGQVRTLVGGDGYQYLYPRWVLGAP